jgi:hypothetical protein
MEIKILGLRYNKINVSRNPNFNGKINLKQNVKINLIEKLKDFKEEGLKVEYTFEVSYGELGQVLIEGVLFVSTDLKTQKNILKNFEDKKINNPENIALMNIIVKKTSIKAIELENELSLPIHIKLPSLQVK